MAGSCSKFRDAMDADFAGRVSRCGTPLRLIFWGGLLCLFDFSFSSQSNGHGFQFDILNDLVGMALITVGVFRILGLRLDEKRRGMLLFVAVVSVVSTAEALLDHFIFPRHELFFWLATLIGLAELTAILFFCVVMKSTFLLFLFILVIPLGSLHLIGIVTTITGSGFSVNLGLEAILVLIVFFIPFIHFLVSTSRMIRAVKPVASEERMALEP